MDLQTEMVFNSNERLSVAAGERIEVRILDANGDERINVGFTVPENKTADVLYGIKGTLS